MLRVGLTGELGSGKSTVARLLAERGAVVLSSDEMGRALMQPGQPVFEAIAARFGPAALAADGTLDRRELARLAFDPRNPRIDELNAIVHPAVIAAQECRIAGIAKDQPDAIIVIESALIFTTKHGGDDEPWRQRFDRIVVVTAPDAVKIARFVERVANGRPLSGTERAALQTDAQQRLAAQRLPAGAISSCLEIENAGDLAALEKRTDEVFRRLNGDGKRQGEVR